MGYVTHQCNWLIYVPMCMAAHPFIHLGEYSTNLSLASTLNTTRPCGALTAIVQNDPANSIQGLKLGNMVSHRASYHKLLSRFIQGVNSYCTTSRVKGSYDVRMSSISMR